MIEGRLVILLLKSVRDVFIFAKASFSFVIVGRVPSIFCFRYVNLDSNCDIRDLTSLIDAFELSMLTWRPLTIPISLVSRLANASNSAPLPNSSILAKILCTSASAFSKPSTLIFSVVSFIETKPFNLAILSLT